MIARITSAAQADLAQALHWYRRHRPGLDRRFIEAFELAIDTISRHPEVGHEVEGSVRRYLLRGFPYALFYLVYKTEVVVVACMHGARDPESWPSGRAA